MKRNVENIQERSYTFPPIVLEYLRTVVPDDIVGEFRSDSYEISLREFCIALDIPLC